MLSKRYELPEVDRRTWLIPSSGTYGPPVVTLTKKMNNQMRLH